MASAISGIPLRFLTFRSHKHPPHKWNQMKNSANAALRFVVPIRHNPHRLPLHPPLSLCLPPLLPRPPLCSLLGPRPPLLRHSLPLMTTPQAAAPDSFQLSSSSAKTVRLVIKGRVQGVFYRDWTVGSATELGLNGWVRNRRDGSVETLFSGNPDAVKEMEQRCRRGPPSAVVTGLEVFPSAEDPGTGFERKQTVLPVPLLLLGKAIATNINEGFITTPAEVFASIRHSILELHEKEVENGDFGCRVNPIEHMAN